MHDDTQAIKTISIKLQVTFSLAQQLLGFDQEITPGRKKKKKKIEKKKKEKREKIMSSHSYVTDAALFKNIFFSLPQYSCSGSQRSFIMCGTLLGQVVRYFCQHPGKILLWDHLYTNIHEYYRALRKVFLGKNEHN